MQRVLLLLAVALFWLVACEESPADTTEEATSDPLTAVEAQADQGQQPVLIYRRSGEAPGDVLQWRIYAGGRGAAITAPAAGEAQLTEVEVDPQAITQLIDDLQGAGFFDVASAGEAPCCRQNNYVLTVQQDGQVSSMAIETVTPQTTQQRLQSLTYVEQFIFEEVTGAAP